MKAKSIGPAISVGWTVLSVITTIIGLSGIPQNIRDWGAFFRMLDGDSFRWALIITGLVSLCFIIYLLITGKAYVYVDDGKPDPLPTPAPTECRFCKGTGHDPISASGVGAVLPCRLCQGKGATSPPFPSTPSPPPPRPTSGTA
jgi:hypothetical protein